MSDLRQRRTDHRERPQHRATRMEQKVAAGQASRIVLNLSHSSVDLTKLSAQLHDWPIAGLQEVKVIDAQGDVIDFYP